MMNLQSKTKNKGSGNILLSNIKQEPDNLHTHSNASRQGLSPSSSSGGLAPNASTADVLKTNFMDYYSQPQSSVITNVFVNTASPISHVIPASASVTSASVAVSARDSQYSTAIFPTAAKFNSPGGGNSRQAVISCQANLPMPTNLTASVFASPSNLLQRLRAKAMPEMSSVLRLDSSVLLSKDARATSEVQKASPNPRGCHVCLYCHRTFSSASLYSNHINRQVARVLYRCHLCPPRQDTAPTPTVVPVLQHPSPSFNYVPIAARPSSSPSPCNLSAPNLCALYVHMAQWHANEPVTAWRLIPSRLSVTAIPWLIGEINTEGADGASRSLSKQQPQPALTIYKEGQDLTDLGNDLDRRLTNLLRTGEFRFLSAEASATVEENSFLRVPDVQSMISMSSRFVPPPLPATDLSIDGFPTSLAPPTCHFLFRLAEASVWHGYFFLAGWYPSVTGIGTQGTSLPLPCAASTEQIEQAYNSLLKDSQSDARGRIDDGRGVLRCLLCSEFRTNVGATLKMHLTGNGTGADVALAKCALCSLSVAHNRRDNVLCSIKAHLLFHLDLFLMCPQCGFTPPPDLTPSLAEICLRLHLRFVCFHFNLVKVFLCLRSPCRKHIFTTMDNFVQHWFEAHTVRKYACQLCVSVGQHRLAEENATEETDSVVRLNGLVYKFSDLGSVCAHLQECHSLSTTSAPTFSQVAYECSECSFVSSVPVDFADHFSSKHCRLGESSTFVTDGGVTATQSRQSPCESQCFYRCFGACRRFLPSIKELRSHMRVCTFALDALKRIFSEELISCTEEASGSAPPAPTSDRRDDPLCLCLYCGISTQKTDSSADRTKEAETRSCALPSMPSGLHRLHAHERVVHMTGGAAAAAVGVTSQVGCPWCGEKLTLSSVSKGATVSASQSNHVDELIKHLRSHAMANPYVAWQIERKRRFNENQKEVVACRCQTGWLDSPLALMAHASAFPTATSNLRSSGGTRLLPFSSLFATSADRNNSTTTGTAEINAENCDVRGDGDGGNAVFTIRPLCQPGGHPPLSFEVYEHLRFGENYDLDEQLAAFHTALKSEGVEMAAWKSFQCPLCLSREATRWALTEHAFFSHHLRLCYMCCRHICGPCTKEDADRSIWEHIFVCLSKRHAALLMRANLDHNGDLEQLQQRCLNDEVPGISVSTSNLHPDATSTAFENDCFADPPSIGVAVMNTNHDARMMLRAPVGRAVPTTASSSSEARRCSPPPSWEPVARKAPRLGSFVSRA